jgi:tetratricopeptide (TPR) repeat protein
LSINGGLASAYQAAGRLSDAIRLHEQVLRSSERWLGEEHRDISHKTQQPGLAYQAAGRLPDALELFEQTLRASERILGPDHPNTSMTVMLSPSHCSPPGGLMRRFRFWSET